MISNGTEKNLENFERLKIFSKQPKAEFRMHKYQNNEIPQLIKISHQFFWQKFR